MKALNREVPWRDIVRQGGATLQEYVESARKEHEQWMTWSLIRPLSTEEAREVLKDPVLGTRVRSRACYRDKSQGQGELRAKTRVVVLGHRDPNLTVINRDVPIPTRLTEQVLLTAYMSGRNRKLLRNERLWRLVRRRDDSAPFLQGQQDQGELPNRLFMMPPRDPILSQAGTCPAELYERERVWPCERPRTIVVGDGKALYDQEGVVDCIALLFVLCVDDFLVTDLGVVRSTLAVEASAADGAIDRGVFANKMFSQIVFGAKANPLTNLKTLRQCHATDCKSLYDAALAANFNTEEKRVGLTIRSVQETIPPSDMRVARDDGWYLGHLPAVVLHCRSNGPDTTFALPSMKAMDLHLAVRFRLQRWVAQPLSSPTFVATNQVSLRRGLHAWRRLHTAREALRATERAGPPSSSEERSWQILRSTFLDVEVEAGMSRQLREERLAQAEQSRAAHRQRLLERWNQQCMAEEDHWAQVERKRERAFFARGSRLLSKLEQAEQGLCKAQAAHGAASEPCHPGAPEPCKRRRVGPKPLAGRRGTVRDPSATLELWRSG
ncbi:unnamed protein product [Cladocopium goreaui]|uniref:Copia protein n=1 Tax=Cladocopium goreaui TaxID=2562237 RepID=A0A9P1BNY8_9DINO|nr:unnamed protein product [Cladocopium goreaui]